MKGVVEEPVSTEAAALPDAGDLLPMDPPSAQKRALIFLADNRGAMVLSGLVLVAALIVARNAKKWRETIVRRSRGVPN